MAWGFGWWIGAQELNWGLGCRAQGVRFRVQGVEGAGFKV